MGLNEPNEILDAFSNIFSSGLNTEPVEIKSQEKFDVNKYFSENTVKELAELSEEDLLTISMKNKDSDGYTAKFIKMKDLLRFIKIKIDGMV